MSLKTPATLAVALAAFLAGRATRPQAVAPAEPVDADDLIRNLRAFADDLEAGRPWALECISDGGEMPISPEEWIDYVASSEWYENEIADAPAAEDDEHVLASA